MGALSGYRVIELAGIGPAPMCAMMLSDMGAEVLRIDRTADAGLGSVMERLGIGPDQCLTRNPRLVYGRMTGWGQEGPLAHAAGHDINYIALAGALHSIGRKDERPVPPLNLVGDFGGGALYLALGVVTGLLEAQKSGKGQVVDTAMVDGVASLMTAIYGMRGAGVFTDNRGENMLDTGAHFYDAYETSDGKYICIGSIEAKFYEELLRLSGLKDEELPRQLDRKSWPAMKERIAKLFRTKTRDEWCRIMEGSDVCFAPVLSMEEAPRPPHNRQRATFVEENGVIQPAPAPRFNRTPSAIQRPPAHPGEHTEEALRDWGFSASDLERLRECGAIASSSGQKSAAA